MRSKFVIPALVFLSLLFLCACQGQSTPAVETPRPITPTALPGSITPLPPSPTIPLSTSDKPAPSFTPNPAATYTSTPRQLSLQNPPLSGDDVRLVEQRLGTLSYAEVGIVDGIFDSQTDAALRHFQYLNSLPITGVLDQTVWNKMFDLEAIAYAQPISFPGALLTQNGTPMCDRHWLQDRLTTLGFMQPGSTEWMDNIFGAETYNAVLAFEKANGLIANGFIDKNDWQALFSQGVFDATGAGIPLPAADELWQTSIYNVGGHPFALAYDGKRLWVALEDYYGEYSLAVVDPSASPALPPLHVTNTWCYMESGMIFNITYAGGKVWALMPDNGYGSPAVQAIQPDTAVSSRPVTFSPCQNGDCFPSSAFGTDGKLLWAGVDDQMYGLSSTTGSQILSTEGSFIAEGRMIFDGRCMWYKGEANVRGFLTGGGTCPRSNEAEGILDWGALAYDGKRLWSTSYGYVIWFDPKTGDYGAPIEIACSSKERGTMDTSLAFDGKRLWVADAIGNTIQALDVETGGIGEPIPLASMPVALLWDGTRLWVAGYDGIVQYLYTDDYAIPDVTPTPTLTPMPTNTPTITLTPSPTIPPLVRELHLKMPRMIGKDVLMVQTRLNELGYTEVGPLDGEFGEMTSAAVKHFQERNGLVADGWVGILTWTALFSPEAKGP